MTSTSQAGRITLCPYCDREVGLRPSSFNSSRSAGEWRIARHKGSEQRNGRAVPCLGGGLVVHPNAVLHRLPEVWA